MTQYIITGEVTNSSLAQMLPYSLVARLGLGVGQSVNLTLATQDETTLIGAGVLAFPASPSNSGGGQQALSPTSVQSSAYSATANQLVPVDASGGAITVTLPSAPADQTRVSVKIVGQASTPNVVTIARSGSAVFNKAGGSTSLTYTALNTAVTVQYQSSTGIWYVLSTDAPLGQKGGAAQLDTTTGTLAASQIPASVVSGVALTVAGLMAQAPFACGHRGGGAAIVPEQTLRGIRQSAAEGIPCINTDVWQGSDGSLIVCHDSTLDRTTTGQGSCEGATAAQMSATQIDAGVWFAPGWDNQPQPTLDEILLLCKQLGIVCSIELKSDIAARPNALSAVVARVVACKMQSATIISSPNQDLFPMTAATNAGITTAFIGGGVTPSIPTLQSWGVGIFYFDLSQAAYTSAYIASLTAAGIWADVWNTNGLYQGCDRRVDWASAQALGARSLTSDDPVYTLGQNAYLTTDPYESQTYAHGMIPSGATRGTFFTTGTAGSLTYWNSITSQYGVLQGWGGRPARQNSIAFTQRYETITSDQTRFGYIAFGCPDDSGFSDGGGFGNGYIAFLRQNGQLQVGKRTGAGAITLGQLSTAAVTARQAVPITITMSGTSTLTIVAKRTDTNDTLTVTDSSSPYAGGFWHFGVNDGAATGVQCSFSQVTLT